MSRFWFSCAHCWGISGQGSDWTHQQGSPGQSLVIMLCLVRDQLCWVGQHLSLLRNLFMSGLLKVGGGAGCTGGPGRPCRPVYPLCPFCPLSPWSPRSPLSPLGPCGPWIGRTKSVAAVHLKLYHLFCFTALRRTTSPRFPAAPGGPWGPLEP